MYVDKQRLIEWLEMKERGERAEFEIDRANAYGTANEEVKTGRFDAPGLAERDAEIRRLSKLVVAANNEMQKLIDQIAALSHQTEQPDTQRAGFEFPRQPGRRGDWVIAPEYLERVTKNIENNHMDVLGGYMPALEDIELVLLAIERMSQPAPKGEEPDEPTNDNPQEA